MRRKILATFQTMLLVSLYLLPLTLSDTASPTGSFSLVNVAPTAPTTLGVQDTSSATVADTSTPDTHMIYSDYFNISWTASTDVNLDTVFYRLCIDDDASGRDNEVCDVFNNMSDASALTTNYFITTDSETGLTYDGASKTFYVRVIATDKMGASENSTAYDASFAVLNSQPDCSAVTMSPTTTHGDLSPALDWADCTDADDGTADHYPADTLKYFVKVGDSQDAGERLAEEDTSTTSAYSGAYDTDLVYNTTEDTGWANSTYHWTVFADDQQGASNSNSSDKYGTFVLYDYLPDVTDVEITDDGQPYSNDYVTPVEKSQAQVAVRVSATDTDGDCDQLGHKTYIHLCLNATAPEVCNETNYDQVWEVDDETGSSGSSCVFVFSANKTTFPTFWVTPAIYKMYANVTATGAYGSGIIRATDAERDGTWEYKSLQGIDYTSTVDLGTLVMGQWNNGTNLYILNNSGNVNMDILWNASDFTGGTYADSTNIDSLSEFQVDDDNIANESVETTLSPFTLNTTARTTNDEFQPSGGLTACDDNACVADGLDTYYHMNLESNLIADTYTNTINLETEAKD